RQRTRSVPVATLWHRRLTVLAALLVLVTLTAASRESVLSPPKSFTAPERFERFPGGAATARGAADGDAFSHPSGNLDFEARARFFVGNGIFTKLWIPSPASTTASDGLGPLFNARSCQGCHLKDGRGHPPVDGADAASFVLGLSVPAPEGEVELPQTASELVVPEPTYGAQLQDHAAPGIPPEGRVRVDYADLPVTLGDGEVVHLRRPTYTVENPAYGPLAKDVMTSPRVAQPMIGLGLLEAISEKDILARADPDDRDGDGISGRANRSLDVAADTKRLGRFGWKAIQPSVAQQSAFAFVTDMGLSSALTPYPAGDCTDGQARCKEAPNGAEGGTAEVPEDFFDRVAFYARNLAVPRRRGEGAPEVLRGKEVFYTLGCTACHAPKFVTGEGDDVAPHLRRQLIWPYSDLLLHDMGEGLADHRPQGLATGREWRTQPLWGIGLTKAVNGHTFLLHDGRARDLTEAILWHGGEAEAARDGFMALSKDGRADLLAFLNSL
ncbi:MAG: c-type cytochrome, partial [Geminicoccaceae bacterium]|nr:c-type cytochrome [Geminicoccaceae bacterium]